MAVNRRKEISGTGEEPVLKIISHAQLIPDESAEAGLTQVEDRIALEQPLADLKLQWRQVLVCRFVDGLTLEETGRKLGVTGQRVGEIQKKALRNLRHRL